jgi:acyl-CoA thioesterase-1
VVSGVWSRVAVLMAAVLLAGTAFGHEQVRTLPDDRATPLLYVALGDSTVKGIGASGPQATYVARLNTRLQSIYSAARVLNLGVGGATSADVVTGQLERATAVRPHLVTLSIGPNDITQRVTVAQYERNVDSILATLTKETDAVVVVNLVPDLAVTPRFAHSPKREAVAALAERFNDVLQRKASAYGVEVVDVHSASRREVPERPWLISEDGYHPSDAGYARWAELMWQGVAARLPRR